MPLQADDAALCARDPQLPGLAAVLDAPALAQSAGLPKMRHAYLRYKPGVSCVAGLIAADGQSTWSAMCYPAKRYAEVKARPHWVNGALFFDKSQTVLMPLRLERRLRAARALSKPKVRARLLDSLGLRGCKLKILRYKLGRRIVLRADGPDGPRAVVKLHADADAFTTALTGAQHSDAAGGPALLGHAPAHRAIAVGWLIGNTLSPSDHVSGFLRAGRALAAAHRVSNATGLARWQPQDTMALAGSLGQVAPHLKAAALGLAADLPPLDGERSVPLHGDFSPDQVVVHPDADVAQIVDWDRAACGDPARDLGSFLASLDLSQIRGTPAETACEAFLTGYEAAGGVIDARSLRHHQAHALFALAQEGFRERRPNWVSEAGAILDRVRALISCPARRVIPGLSEAMTGDRMRPKLRQLVGQDMPNVEPELLRLKPGRRALVRYALSDGSAVLGKLRAKGPDRRAACVQAGLRAAGLDGSQGIGVPSVRGTLESPGLWLQTEVPGTPLGALLQRSNAASALSRTGRALAALHTTPPQTKTRWTAHNELEVLRRAIGEGPYADLLHPAQHTIEALPYATPTGLHRDFYFDQVIVDADVTWLVDLDLHAIGDPSIDIGNFRAHLIELALRKGKTWSHFEPLDAAFLEGYATARPCPPRSRIETFTWVSLARHIGIAAGFEDRRYTIPTIAELCRERLGAQPASVRRTAM